MTHLVLIGCSSRKAEETCTVRNLYKGDLFKLSVQWAESKGFPWAVLSAKHGLIFPDTVIEPYNVTLNNMKKKDRHEWACGVALKIIGMKVSNVIFLAGSAYRDPLTTLLLKQGITSETPLAGLGIGLQLRKLKHEITTDL